VSAAGTVVYWDASAILSALFRDRHSAGALAWGRQPGVHLISTLAWAEAHAVIGRAARERALASVLIEAARETLARGPWRRVYVSPDWHLVRDLSGKWPLRGADLWHLATAKTLQAELPELTILSYDERLGRAAHGEGLAPARRR
jgi:predicted nucleic acid-binding protein